MTQYAQSLLTLQETSFIQAAEADIMTTRVRAIFAAAVDDDDLVTALTLAGGGDGHTFVTEMTQASAVVAGDPLDVDSVLIFYIAASESELAVAKAAAVASLLALPPPDQGAVLEVTDDQLAGAAKGTRFMGLLVATWTTPG